MSSTLNQKAAQTVAKIMAETTALPRTAFEEHRDRPFEFGWAWEGQVGQSDYTYQKRYTDKVVAARTTKASRGGGAKATGLAAMILPCPRCSSSHSPLNPCA